MSDSSVEASLGRIETLLGLIVSYLEADKPQEKAPKPAVPVAERAARRERVRDEYREELKARIRVMLLEFPDAKPKAIIEAIGGKPTVMYPLIREVKGAMTADDYEFPVDATKPALEEYDFAALLEAGVPA